MVDRFDYDDGSLLLIAVNHGSPFMNSILYSLDDPLLFSELEFTHCHLQAHNQGDNPYDLMYENVEVSHSIRIWEAHIGHSVYFLPRLGGGLRVSYSGRIWVAQI